MVLTNNIISYWKFENNGNDEVSSNTLTISGATFTASGKINGAYSYNGSSNYMSKTNLLNMQSFSYSAWFKSNNTEGGTGSNYQTIMGYRLDTGNFNWRFIWITTAGKLEAYLRAGGVMYTLTDTTTLTDNTWYFVTLTWDGTTARLYLNGTQVDSDALGALTFETTNFAVGRTEGRNLDYFYGVIDEVGIWSRALSATEVTDLYNSGNGLTYPFGSTTTTTYKSAGLKAKQKLKRLKEYEDEIIKRQERILSERINPKLNKIWEIEDRKNKIAQILNDMEKREKEEWEENNF